MSFGITDCNIQDIAMAPYITEFHITKLYSPTAEEYGNLQNINIKHIYEQSLFLLPSQTKIFTTV